MYMNVCAPPPFKIGMSGAIVCCHNRVLNFFCCNVNLFRIGRIDCTLCSRPACNTISHMKFTGVAQHGRIDDVDLDPSRYQGASSIVKHHLPLLNVLCAKSQRII